MSDVEKAISGLVEDEEQLQFQQQQNQQQQHSTPLNKINISNYNLQNETGDKSLLQKPNPHHHHHPHYQVLQQNSTNSTTPNTTTNYLTSQQYNYLSRLAKIIFSTPGLVVMVVAYTIMGAFIFPLLEAPQDISKSVLIAKSREECLKELWIITEKLNVLYERNWTMLVHEQLKRFEGTIVAATRNIAASTTTITSGATTGGYGGGVATETTTTALGRYGGNSLAEYSDLTATKWSFSEALLYSVTVITTIGHGSLTPRTAGGKIATIFYALIGVPLMLMCLSSLGAVMAEALQCTYARLCCHSASYVSNGGDDLDDKMLRSKHKHKQLQAPAPAPAPAQRIKFQQSKHANSISKDVAVEKDAHQEAKRCFHQYDFQEHKNGINCKHFKYDAIIGESNTNHGYDYKLCNDATAITTKTVTAATTTSATSSSSSLLSSSYVTTAAVTIITTTTSMTTPAMTTMKLGHKEDCCQLLPNTPGEFIQHLSSCKQLKMSPTRAISSSSRSATPATTMAPATETSTKQYYQQRPDVIVMTTGHKLSLQQPVTMTTACRMALPLPTATIQRFYHNTAPTMATYHIVSSASVNSSPTYQQSIRHYIVPQMAPPPISLASLAPSSSSLASIAGTQHFMAVPTNVLRFHQTSQQTTTQQQLSCAGNTTSNININQLALPASGSTTVYFPIVTPAATTQKTVLTGGSLGVISQPLIKYHTLQLPHKRQQNIMMLQQTDFQDNHIISNSGDADNILLPPPPPPAYQTATVHGIRRAKFLTKPLPQEINTLLHESDITHRHDLSQYLQTFTNDSLGGEQQLPQHSVTASKATITTTSTSDCTPTLSSTTHSIMLPTIRAGTETKSLMAKTAATTNLSNFYSDTTVNIASSTPPPLPPPPSSLSSLSTTLTNYVTTNSNSTIAGTTIYENHESIAARDERQVVQAESDRIGATTAVDIMEDEEEQEQQRLGNCPHGTPSRVPLLTCSSSVSDEKYHARNFLNTTAASFHRHTLNTFQKSVAQRRSSVIINRKGECNLHIKKRRNSTNATVCYDDNCDDISEDDCGILEGKNAYRLKHLHHTNAQTDKHLVQEDFCDNHSLVSYTESTSQIPQVPIIVVLFILILYVCLGTVIFALWENWSMIDGAYFCFVTLTTIGYGDFMPLKTFQGPEIQLFACCAYLLLGLVLVAMSFSILETQLIWKCKHLAVRLKLAKE